MSIVCVCAIFQDQHVYNRLCNICQKRKRSKTEFLENTIINYNNFCCEILFYVYLLYVIVIKYIYVVHAVYLKLIVFALFFISC